MKRLLVNDAMSQLGEITFWHMLQEWFDMEFWGKEECGECNDHGACTRRELDARMIENRLPPLIIRNATYISPFDTNNVPTISLLQDIIPEGPLRTMQEAVIKSSRAVVFNSSFTHEQYVGMGDAQLAFRLGLRAIIKIIPLPVDFTVFTPQNVFICQQTLALPEGCVLWIGASQGAAGHVKGYDTFLSIVRQNPDINFVAVFKDAAPESVPPNLRCYVRLSHADLVRVIGACRVGLCTSRTESQHLAGIEMGACGLPLVVPPVGIYWKREAMRGNVVQEPSVGAFAMAVREMLARRHDGEEIREYWRGEFDVPVVREAWMKLVKEVECSGAS